MRQLTALIALAALAGLACDKATPVAPSGATITLTITPTQIAADGQASVTAVVRKEDGNPVNPGTEVSFSTTLGVVEPQTAVTSDRGIAEATLQGTGEGGTATVTAISGAAGDVSVDVRIGFVAASIVLSADPTNVPLEGGVIELIATVRDTEGQLLKDIAVNFDAETGSLDTLEAVFTDSNGVARNRVTVTSSDLTVLEEFFFVVSAVAATEGGALLEDITEINVFGGVAFISLQATPSTVPDDSTSVIQLLALVQDDIGEPVEGAGVNFSAEIGTLASGGGLVRSSSAGEAIDTLTVTPEDISALTQKQFTVGAEAIGLDGLPIEETFTILLQTDAPVVAFTAANGAVANQIVFTFTGFGEEPLTFFWTFGDPGASTSTARNPTFTYPAPGVYNVILVVTDRLGREGIADETITVPIP